MGTGFLFKRPKPQPFELNIDEFQKRLNDCPPPPSAASNMTPPKTGYSYRVVKQQKSVASAGSETKRAWRISDIFWLLYCCVAIIIGFVYGWGWGLLAFFSIPILFAFALTDL